MSLQNTSLPFPRVVALSGGVGGARFLHGVSRALPAGSLTAIVNTGDDFEHWGLAISPDLDTVMYTLSDLANEERGWGLEEESFQALSMMKRYGAEDWFALGDRDLATHLFRSAALRRGDSLSQVTEAMCLALGIEARVLPMADAPCKTMIDTEDGRTLTFQDWFVKNRAPLAKRVWFDASPKPAPGVIEAIREADVVLIGPSNPYVSIDPITRLDGVREALQGLCVVAVSPIVGGVAVKGPLAEMIPRLAEREPSAGAIAAHYGELLSGMVVERGDGASVARLPVLETATVMKSRAASRTLAEETLAFAASLG